MRCQRTRTCGGDIVQEIARGRLRAVSHDDGRVVVSIAQHDTERVELAGLRDLDARSDFGAQARASLGRVFDAVLPELIANQRVIGHGLVHHVLVDGTSFPLVAVQQRRTAPALQHGGDLPAEIDSIGDTHVHSISTKRRMKVTCVACEKDAAIAIFVGDQPAGDPLVGTQHFDGNVDPGRVPDQRRHFVVGDFAAFTQLRRHEVPLVASVHGPDHARNVAIDLPVHDRRPVLVRLRESRRAEHDVVVARKTVRAVHPGTNGRSHGTSRAIRADQIVAIDAERAPAAHIANLCNDALVASLEREQLTAESQGYAGKRLGMRAQHLFHRVLRDPLRVLGIERILPRRAVHRILELRQQMAI